MKQPRFLPIAFVLMLALASCRLVPLSVPADQSSATTAQLDIRFIESAPKDRFTIENSSSCEFKELTVVIDLAESAGKLIFDTTESGAGVEVFQPFEVAEGQIELISSGDVQDGDTELAVRIMGLQPQERVGFTIDVDDTLPDSELGMIRVSGSEINGGIVRINESNQEAVTTVFDSNSRASLALACAAS